MLNYLNYEPCCPNKGQIFMRGLQSWRRLSLNLCKSQRSCFWHRCRGSNPGRPRDRRKYLPLYYNLRRTLSSNQKSTKSTIKNLGVQVGQLAKQIAEKSSNNFGANTEKNPKEECKAIMTRSRRPVLAENEGEVTIKNHFLWRMLLRRKMMRNIRGRHQ